MTQHEKILNAFRDAPGNIVSAGYLKHELYISEVNGRISELRKKGYVFESMGLDEHGFKKHRLVQEPEHTKPAPPIFGDKHAIHELRRSK